MADNYIRKLQRFTYVPGTPGTPSSPGQPYQPAYCNWESVETFTLTYTCYDANGQEVNYVGQGIQGQDSGSLEAGLPLQGVYHDYGNMYCTWKQDQQTELVQVCYPEQPYIPPVVGVEPTEAQTTYDDNLGWNAGAVSIEPLIGTGAFIAEPQSCSGIIVGLCNAPETVGYGYKLIDFAFHIEGTKVRAMENGLAVSSFVGFTPGVDSIMIIRDGLSVRYVVGSQTIYNSTQIPATVLYADISLYAAGDQLNNAAIVNQESTLLGPDEDGNPHTTLSGSASTVAGAQVTLAPGSTSGKGSISAYFYDDDTKYHWAGSASAGAGSVSQAQPDKVQAFGTATMDAKGRTQQALAEIVDPPISQGTNSVMAEIVGVSSDYNYQYSEASMAGMTSEAEDGLLQPSIARSSTQLIPISTSGLMLTGETSVSSDMTMGYMDTISADHNYGESEVTMGYMACLSGEEQIFYGLADVVPSMTMEAYGRAEAKNGLDLPIPAMTLEAQTGAQMEAITPSMTLSISGEIQPVGEQDGALPALTLEASGVMGGVGEMAGNLPAMTLEALTGSGMAKIMPMATITATGTVDAVAEMEGRVSRITVTATGTMGAVGNLAEELPALVMEQVTQASMVVPTLLLNATATMGAGYTARVLAVSVDTGKVGELQNFNFNGLGLIGSDQFLLNSSGLFMYGGTDDAGTSLDSYATLAATDNKSPRLKRMPYAYISGRGEGTISVAQVTMDGAGTAQVSDNKYHTGTGNRRAKLSRKTKSRYLGVHLEAKGKPMYVEGVEMITQISDRRR